MAWQVRSPIKFLDDPSLKEIEKILIYYEGSIYVTPVVDNVPLTAMKTLFVGTAGGKNYGELPTISSGDFINGRTVSLLVENYLTNAGKLISFDVLSQPMICGTDQLTTTSYDYTSELIDGGDKNQHKEWNFLWVFYKGTPTIYVYNNTTPIILVAPATTQITLPAATTKQKYQIVLRGNFGSVMRWRATGAAPGGIYSVKPVFMPIVGGSMV